MATDLDLDDELIELAVRLGQHHTKREAVDAALRAYVDHLRRLRSVDAFGSFDFDEEDDDKQARRAR